jgi:glycolate oxidase FAD binding subunit
MAAHYPFRSWTGSEQVFRVSSVDKDITDALQSRVRQAAAGNIRLRIEGGNSKSFYGRAIDASALSVREHRGVINYEPTELVVTARAGTRLAEIESVLAAQHQMLPFEPPHFGESATLGGTIACNLSGPRRPYCGAARDHVLGIRLLNGKGDVLAFGGEVMKNVAGYDVSRLMAGAMGTLGVLLDISLKLLPSPAKEVTLFTEVKPDVAIEAMNRWAGQPVPLSAACYDGNRMVFRLSGSERAVDAAVKRIGGDIDPSGNTFWRRLREHRAPFFDSTLPLWRVAVRPTAPPLELPGRTLIDWGGGLRWVTTDAPPARVRAVAEAHGGHALLFRGGNRDEVFAPLQPGVGALHRNLKRAFDPAGILNIGRMYADF